MSTLNPRANPEIKQRVAPMQLGPQQRRWADLKLWRLCLGLVLAPVIPFALATLAFEVLSRGFVLQEMAKAVAIILGCAVAWSLVAGPAYFLGIARLRRHTGRTECLLLGTATAATLPAAAILTLIAMPKVLNDYLRIGEPEPLMELLPYCLVIGLILAPFGLLGGWILWRAGVRPAPLHVPDVTAVFD
jgi:hypothetical protein